jgi:hypothetical protein
MKLNIKPQNAENIRKLITGDLNDCPIQGARLIALHRLIQSRGETIQTEDRKLNGEKAYRFSETEYIAIKHRPTNKDSFFPCSTTATLLQNIKP